MLVSSLPCYGAARILSDSDCPAAEAVSERLWALLPVREPGNATARLRIDGPSMRIDLSAVGEQMQSRLLPADGDCAARAELAAYVIAAWLDAMPVRAVRAPGIPPRERPPIEEPTPLRLFDEPLSISTATMLGAALVGESDSAGAAVGALVLVGMPNLVEEGGWVAEASYVSAREIALGQGKVSFRRATFTVALTYDFYRARWIVRGQLGAGLGVLMTTGSGFVAANSATSVMWGLDLGLVLARRFARDEAWLGLGALGWPQGRSVYTRVDGSSQTMSEDFPSWDFRLVVGYSFGVL